MAASERLRANGIQLPAVTAPLASYVPALKVGDQVLTSGQLPIRDGELLLRGKLGDGITVEQGAECARQAAINALAAVCSQLHDIDQIIRVVRLCVYVASTPDFTDQAKVANGASEFLLDIFDDAGRHVRSAVGVASLPLDAPVEVELVVQV